MQLTKLKYGYVPRSNYVEVKTDDTALKYSLFVTVLAWRKTNKIFDLILGTEST